MSHYRIGAVLELLSGCGMTLVVYYRWGRTASDFLGQFDRLKCYWGRPSNRVIGEWIDEAAAADSLPQLIRAVSQSITNHALLLIPRILPFLQNNAFVNIILRHPTLRFLALDVPNVTVSYLRSQRHALRSTPHTKQALSAKIRAGIAIARANGVALGNPRIADARVKALAAHHAARPSQDILMLMVDWRQAGQSLRTIARGLNERQVKPPRGGLWYAPSVSNILASVQMERPPVLPPVASSR